MILFTNQLQLPLQRKNIVVTNLSTILTMYIIDIKNESVIICNHEGESIEYVRCERYPEVFPHFKFVLYHSTPIKTSWRSSRVLACNRAKTLDTVCFFFAFCFFFFVFCFLFLYFCKQTY